VLDKPSPLLFRKYFKGLKTPEFWKCVGLATLFSTTTIFAIPQNNGLLPKDGLTKDNFIVKGKVAGASTKLPSNKDLPLLKMDALQPPNDISALSLLAIDSNSGKTLYEKNPRQPLPPASTTKIVTALVIMESYDMSSFVKIPTTCLGIEGNNVGFAEGEMVSIEHLLYGMLVKSASDASCALATIEGEPIKFVSKMNKKAESLGLANTHFTNEIGFDAVEENHLSTAEDLLILAREAMKNGMFRIIVGTRQMVIPSFVNPKASYFVSNTNELLYTIPGTTGIKTGNTEKAKGCLVFSYENLGKNILIVALGSNDRFGDTKKILNWILSSYKFN
jgi:D-alanyl-D-alanine carboxypeptidase